MIGIWLPFTIWEGHLGNLQGGTGRAWVRLVTLGEKVGSMDGIEIAAKPGRIWAMPGGGREKRNNALRFWVACSGWLWTIGFSLECSGFGGEGKKSVQKYSVTVVTYLSSETLSSPHGHIQPGEVVLQYPSVLGLFGQLNMIWIFYFFNINDTMLKQ